MGGGQNRFSKNLIFKRFAAKFFSKVSRRFSEGQKGSVNLTFNAFLHRKFSSMYIFVPGSPKGVVYICVLVGWVGGLEGVQGGWVGGGYPTFGTGTGSPSHLRLSRALRTGWGAVAPRWSRSLNF